MRGWLPWLAIPALVLAGALVFRAGNASGNTAPDIDVTGLWNLHISSGAFNTACDTQFTQFGTDVTGDWLCSPGTELTGTIKQAATTVTFDFEGDVIGYHITASGTVANDANTMSGTWSTTGASGTFSGTRKLSATVTPTVMPSNTPTTAPTQAATNTPHPGATNTPMPTAPPATPTTSAGLRGDPSCDGVINSIDAALDLQFGAALVMYLPCQANADVNRDGLINSLDAALILQYAAGLVHAFP